jgi:rod shape-determining protein MreC
MQWIISLIIGHRTIASLITMVCISLVLLTSNTSRQQQIARALTMSVFYPFQFYLSQTTRIKNIFAENRTMKQEIAEQSARIAFLKERALGIERLEELLQLKNEQAAELVAARIVAKEPANISRGVIINIGSQNGITPYMPIINDQGVVGKVIQTTAHMAMVQLLIDPSNRASVLIQRTREVGILETENGINFFIKCRIHADVEKGDTIVTSGLGGVYPKGLQVGIISKIQEMQDPLFKKLIVTIGVDFNHIEEVFVMQVKSQWASFREEMDTLGQKQ